MKPLSNCANIETAGHLLAQMLVDYGVTHVFGMPGGQTLAFYDGINRLSPRINHVVLKDERSAVYAADCYARLTNKPGVCDATVGPGATKLPSGMSEALNSSIPLIVIVSDLPQRWHKLRPWGCASQGINQHDLLRSVAKDILEVKVDGELPAVVRRAFALATTGRPGPVVITIPEDLLDKPVNEEQLSKEFVEPIYGIFPAERPAAPEREITAAAEILSAAARPVLVVGGGAMISQACFEVRRLAEMLGAPVVTSFSAKGILSDDHPLSLGLVGNMGTVAARKVFEAADVVFLVGMKSGQNTTFNWKLPYPSQRIIQMDIDPTEVGKVFPAEVGIVSDAKTGLGQLIERLQGDCAQGLRSNEGHDYKKDGLEPQDQETNPISDVVLPQQVALELNNFLEKNSVLVCDASFASGWGGIYCRAKTEGKRFIFPRGSAGLGFSLPAAIGACYAPGIEQVVCLTGDGGLCYALGELATLSLYHLKIVVIVLNNSSYGWIKWVQRLRFDGRYQSVDLPDIDYSLVGPAFGLKGISVEAPQDLRGALEEAFRSPTGAIVNVKTSVWETPVLSFQERLEKQRQLL